MRRHLTHALVQHRIVEIATAGRVGRSRRCLHGGQRVQRHTQAHADLPVRARRGFGHCHACRALPLLQLVDTHRHIEIAAGVDHSRGGGVAHGNPDCGWRNGRSGCSTHHRGAQFSLDRNGQVRPRARVLKLRAQAGALAQRRAFGVGHARPARLVLGHFRCGRVVAYQQLPDARLVRRAQVVPRGDACAVQCVAHEATALPQRHAVPIGFGALLGRHGLPRGRRQRRRHYLGSACIRGCVRGRVDLGDLVAEVVHDATVPQLDRRKAHRRLIVESRLGAFLDLALGWAIEVAHARLDIADMQPALVRRGGLDLA